MTDLRFLHFFLDLEYLQAEFYLRALNGVGLDVADRGVDAGPVVGGRKVAFSNPLCNAFVKATAGDELNHVRVLRSLITHIGGTPNPAPPIDFSSPFSSFAVASGLCREEQVFNAFHNETNLLLAAYIFEDVVTATYLDAISAIADPYCLEIVAGIMAAEACQSAMIRILLSAAGFGDATNAVSLHRQALTKLIGTAYQGNDHGVGTMARPSIAALDSRSLFPRRTMQQCRQILCGNSAGKPGSFFPAGLGEAVEDLGPFTPIADAHLAVVFDAMIAEKIASYPSELVELPPLPFSAEELAAFDFRENVPIQPWSETSYRSQTPHVHVVRDAIVHGTVGIVAIGPHVVNETLWHTDPPRHRYKRQGDQVVLFTKGVEHLEGATVSILVGAAESYWHSVIDATARLTLIPDSIWQSPTCVLLPSSGVKQLEFFKLFGLPEWVSPRVVATNDTFRVEKLIYPSSLHGLFDYHPTLLNRCFDRLLANTPPSVADMPKRLFVDRRKSSLRKLVNEQQVLDALPNFTPVALEALTIVEQLQLFAHADIIVAPHGAGLTNIGFARPGAVVVELMMDTYCNWCYRRLSALRGLTYLCVLGRSLDPWKAEQSLHLQTWTIDIGKVLSTVELAETRAAMHERTM